MDKNRAFEIFGLTDKATPDEINKRVAILYKKFKQLDKDKQGNTLIDIEEAYESLSGITYHDKEADEKRNYRKKHPNLFFKLLRVDEEKTRNLIYYYKWHAVISLVVIALVVSTVISIVNKVEPDLKIIVTGEIYLEKTELLEERINNEVEGVSAVQIQNVYLSENSDAQMQMMMQQKFVTEVAAGENDIFILDEKMYRDLSKQGAFKPMENFIDDLGDLSLLGEDIKNLEVVLDLEDGNTYEPVLYGLDVSHVAFLRDTGIIGESLIVAFGVAGKETQNAEAFIKKLLELELNGK